MLGATIGYPQIFVRGQSSTIGTAGTMDAYMLFLEDSANRALLARQRGTGYNTSLVTINLTSSINTTDRYRMRMSATGTSPTTPSNGARIV